MEIVNSLADRAPPNTEQGQEGIKRKVIWDHKEQIYKTIGMLNEALALLNTKHGNNIHSPYVLADLHSNSLHVYTDSNSKPRMSFIDVKTFDQLKLYKEYLKAADNLKNVMVGPSIYIDGKLQENLVSDNENLSYTEAMKFILKKVRMDLLIIENDSINHGVQQKHNIIKFDKDYTRKQKSFFRGLYNLLGPQRMSCFTLDPSTNRLSLNLLGSKVVTKAIKDIWKEYRERSIYDCKTIFSKSFRRLIEMDNLVLSEKEILDIIEHLSSEDFSRLDTEDNNIHGTSTIKEQRSNQGVFMNQVVTCFRLMEELPYEETNQLHDMIALELDSLGIDNINSFIRKRVKKMYSVSVKVNTKPESGFGTDLLGLCTVINADNFETDDQKNEEVIRQMKAITDKIKELEQRDNPYFSGFDIKSVKIANKGVLPKGKKTNGIVEYSDEEKKLLDELQSSFEDKSIVNYRNRKNKVGSLSNTDITKTLPDNISNSDKELIQNFIDNFSFKPTGSNGEYQDCKLVFELELDCKNGEKKTVFLEWQVIRSDNNNLVGLGNHHNLERQKAVRSKLRQSLETSGENLMKLGVNSLQSLGRELKNIREIIKEDSRRSNTGKPRQTYYTTEQLEKEDDLSFAGYDGKVTDLLREGVPEGDKVLKLFGAAEYLINKDIKDMRIIQYASPEELNIDSNKLVTETDMPCYEGYSYSLPSKRYEFAHILEKEQNKKFRGRNTINNLLTGTFDPDKYFVIPHPSDEKKGLALKASVLAYIITHNEHTGN